MKKESIEKIKNKAVLLDTNVLIDSSKYPSEFKSFYSLLQENSVKSILNPIAKLEFTRSARTKDEIKAQELFLDKLLGKPRFELDTHNETFKQILEYSKNISLIYVRLNDNKAMSLGDLLIGSIMAKYFSNSILATQNHSDFLPPLFKLIDLELIRLGSGKIKVIGFYEFDDKEYTRLLKELDIL